MDSISLILNSLQDWTETTNKLLNNYKLAIEKCNYKNKEDYVTFLNSLEIPKIFCIDENNTISYIIRGHLIIRTKKRMGGIWNPPITLNHSEKGKLTAISAIWSGKKQEAVNLTAQKRRMLDGTYKGAQQTIVTRNSRHDWSEITTKIAKKRKLGDGYKNVPHKLNIEKIKELLNKIHPDYILLSETYINNKKKLKFLCNKKHYFEMRWNSVVIGQECPNCIRFIQEDLTREIIEKVFNEKFIKIKPEWLINPNSNKRLELDGYCEKLKIAFEYDGQFHYHMPENMGGKEVLDKTRIRDKIKDRICKKLGVFLIRISYKVKDREKYIRKQRDKWLKLYQKKN